MPRTVDLEEFDEYDENEEPEFDSDDDGLDTAPCPYCHAEIYEDADVCPYCGSFVLMEETRSSLPQWVIWTAVLLLVLILTGFTCLL